MSLDIVGLFTKILHNGKDIAEDEYKISVITGLPSNKRSSFGDEENDDKFYNKNLYDSENDSKEEENNNWEYPLFIEQHKLNDIILEVLRPMHEKWAGLSLIEQVAYGLRIYRN